MGRAFLIIELYPSKRITKAKVDYFSSVVSIDWALLALINSLCTVVRVIVY